MKDPKLDHDAESIRLLLTSMAPDDPGVSQRAVKVAARVRRQRTRRGVVSVVAVAAAAAAVVIVPSLYTTNPTTNEATDPGNDVRTQDGEQGVDPFATTPCPRTPVDLGTAAADKQTTDTIRADVESIRLCAATVEGSPESPWLPPADALQLNLGGPFISGAADATQADKHRCDAARAASDPYIFVVRYPDGDTESVAVDNICTDLTVDGKRLAAPAVLTLFQEALSSQRRELTADAAKGTTVDCRSTLEPGGRAYVATTRGPRPTAETRFAAFFSCTGTGPAAVNGAAVAMLNEQWAASIRDMATQQAEPLDRCPDVDVDVPSTYGVTTWGDVLEFDFRGCGNYLVRGYAASEVPDAFGPPSVQFLPSEELADALGLLFDLS